MNVVIAVRKRGYIHRVLLTMLGLLIRRPEFRMGGLMAHWETESGANGPEL